MTKAQAKKRLKEAKAKVKAVYLFQPLMLVTTQDLVAIEKILDKCLKRCQ